MGVLEAFVDVVFYKCLICGRIWCQPLSSQPHRRAGKEETTLSHFSKAWSLHI